VEVLGWGEGAAGELGEELVVPRLGTGEGAAVCVVRRVVGEHCEPGEDELVAQREWREVVLGNE